MKIKNLILGAGISGLAAASVLEKENTVVFEKENYYGGLCNSFNINGFTFDTSIHLSFTNNIRIREYFDKIEYNTHLPISYNFWSGYWLKHPVIHNLYKIPVKDKIECIKGFVERPQIEKINNYNEWLLATYGKDIVEKFHSKYTRKYWCKASEELSTTWVGERLNTPKLENMLSGAFQENNDIEYYAKEMRYPKEGGYKAFLNPLYEKSRVELNKEAIKINTKEKYVRFKDESTIYYENIISSLPINEVVKLLDNVPQQVIKSSENLLNTSVALVSIGFNKPDIPKYLWFYIYDEDILPARVYSPSLKSKNNAPDGCSSLQFEIYYSKDKKLNMSEDDILQHVRQKMIDMNICKEKDILFMDYREVKYANVTFYNNMEYDRDIVKEYLNNQGIILIGRFGEWDYLWSDQSYLSGLRVIDNIK